MKTKIKQLEQTLPVEQEAEPKPRSSLCWTRGPCDAAPAACWEKASSVLRAHTCRARTTEGGGKEGEKRNCWQGGKTHE